MHALVATPNGGLHAYFAGTGQPSGRLPRHHLDFKAVGGYVLAPPSVVNGTPYRLLVRWPESGGPDSGRLESGGLESGGLESRGPESGGLESRGLDWMAAISLLDPGRRRPVRPDLTTPRDAGRLVAWVGRLQPGNRNAGLYWAACRAVEAGQLAVLDQLAAAAARTGLPDHEITRIINSARRSAPGQSSNASESP